MKLTEIEVKGGGGLKVVSYVCVCVFYFAPRGLV